ncbi:hypothetical protein V8B97DRAFT_1877295, partial [Scleroderma yunnanense]
LMNEDHEEQYFNSFCTNMVTLSNDKQLYPHVALQQLHAGIITKQDMVAGDGCEECKYLFYSIAFHLNDCHQLFLLTPLKLHVKNASIDFSQQDFF